MPRPERDLRCFLARTVRSGSRGPAPGARRPGFSDDPLDGFRHLSHDLGRFCAEFLSGDASVLRRAAPAEMARLQAEHRVRLAGYAGDERARREARAYFLASEYDRVVALLEGVQYPEQLTESERRMLELARRRAGGL